MHPISNLDIVRLINEFVGMAYQTHHPIYVVEKQSLKTKLYRHILIVLYLYFFYFCNDIYIFLLIQYTHEHTHTINQL